MSDTTTITLPITPATAWGIVALIAFVVVCALVSLGLPRSEAKNTAPFDTLRQHMGLKDFDPGLFLFVAVLWCAIAAFLTLGLLYVLWGVVARAVPEGAIEVGAFRFALAQVAGLTAVLGAVVTLPITLTRLKITREQKDLTDEALFNDKINEASTQLAARRQVTHVIRGKDGAVTETNDEWEDDIVVRASAIDRLEGLANERPEEIPRIARMLSVYVRELSRASTPQNAPEDPNHIYRWSQTLKPFRPDVEKAMQSLGRLQTIKDADVSKIEIDLRMANLQGFDMAGLTFETRNVSLTGARMEGTNLREAQIEGALLGGARLEGANLFKARMERGDFAGAYLQRATLSGAKMSEANFSAALMEGARMSDAQMEMADLSFADLEGANLERAQMQGANLSWAKLEGAYLHSVRMDENTELSNAYLKGAAVKSVNISTIVQLRPYWHLIIADGTVCLSDDERPEHWPTEELADYTWSEAISPFHQAWRKWQRSIGMDPDNP